MDIHQGKYRPIELFRYAGMFLWFCAGIPLLLIQEILPQPLSLELYIAWVVLHGLFGLLYWNLTRYLPAQLAPRLAQGGLEELRRGKRQQMGVLFIDMRGFTSWSQHRSPQAISEFMTEFRRRILGVANSTGGVIDKFIGDAAMIVFESEADSQAAARSCVTCAEQLDSEMAGWSHERVAAGEPEVRVGVGLHWGEVFSGVVGDQDRLEYSVFGDTVNTAARLEEMTKTLGVDIVASRDILEQAGFGPEPSGWTTLAGASVRGRTGTVEILGRTVV